MFTIHREELTWSGRPLVLESGRLARQADGAVLVKYGGTSVLCTTVCARKAKPGQDFFPLTVHYLERSYAAGRIPGGFFKREGRPSEFETLTSRLIDRPLRPLFHSRYLHETQVVCTTLEHDMVNSPDIPALIGAATATALSGAPLQSLVGAARVGLIDDTFVINPELGQMKDSTLDLVVAGTKDGVLMVESECQELSEEQMLDAVMAGHEAFQPVLEAIQKLVTKCDPQPIPFEETFPGEDKIQAFIKKEAAKPFRQAYSITDKQERTRELSTIRQSVQDAVAKKFPQEDPDSEAHQKVLAASFTKKQEADILRTDILKKGIRIDKRDTSTVRPIIVETGVLERTHGSAVFTRGETQALVVATLGTGQDEQIIDALAGEYRENFLLHYNFPPYSVNEASPLRPPGRREIGHGKLAWRALRPLMPKGDNFSYSVRLVSEILESNGSSSMATVCGGSLALMDAGVPLKSSCAGIAMGLIKEGDDYAVLTDILGDEDHLGDMDFKVAGTGKGITSLQMDIKITSITKEIMTHALADARNGRLHILGIMDEAINAPRQELSEFAPRIQTIQIPKDKIRDIIGTGGKVIREICEATTTRIDIDDDGKIHVSSANADSITKALDWINGIVADPEVGTIYSGKVVKIMAFGAFVNFMGSRDGMVHISELAPYRVDAVEDIVKEGQTVFVECVAYDSVKGKARLSMRTVDQESGEKKEVRQRDRNSTGPRDRGGSSYRDRGSSGSGHRDSRDRGSSGSGQRDRSNYRGSSQQRQRNPSFEENHHINDVGFLAQDEDGPGRRRRSSGAPQRGKPGNRTRRFRDS